MHRIIAVVLCKSGSVAGKRTKLPFSDVEFHCETPRNRSYIYFNAIPLTLIDQRPNTQDLSVLTFNERYGRKCARNLRHPPGSTKRDHKSASFCRPRCKGMCLHFAHYLTEDGYSNTSAGDRYAIRRITDSSDPSLLDSSQ